MKASFLIKAREENVVTEKGLRAFVLEMLLNSSVCKGAVENIGKKTVQVRLEGDEKQVRQFAEELKKAVIAEFGNPKILFTALEENPALEVPDLMRSSQALLLGQLQKGIGIQLDILEGQKDIVNGQKDIVNGQKDSLRQLTQELRNLPKELAAALKENA